MNIALHRGVPFALYYVVLFLGISFAFILYNFATVLVQIPYLVIIFATVVRKSSPDKSSVRITSGLFDRG